MSLERIDINRFWLFKDGVFDLNDGGYVRDPEGDCEWLGSSVSASYKDIEDTRCLILLG